MSVKKISFKVTKASTYYTLGAVRFYDENGNLYPIKFSTKDQTLENIFYIQGTPIGGKVNTTNSYSTYYYVDSPFDTDKPIATTYSQKNYWLSSVTDTISITFDIPIKISRIDFVPYVGDGGDRKQNAVEITAIDHSNKVAMIESYDTSSYVGNQVYTAQTKSLMSFDVTLLKAKNKVFSLKYLSEPYETKMTSNTTPSPLVASASTSFSSSYYPWKAFNGTNIDHTDCWATASGIATGWVQIDFGKKTKINTLKLTSRNSSDTSQYSKESFPSEIVVYGSDDGLALQKIGEFENLKVSSHNETIELKLKLPTEYRYYRVQVNKNNGYSTFTTIAKIEFLYNSLNLLELLDDSINNFLSYGATELKSLSSVIHNKDYILQDNISEDANGLWTKKVDRKPLSIKFK